MKRLFKSMLALLLCLCMVPLVSPAAQAEESVEAEKISLKKAVTDTSGFSDWGYLYDGELLKGGKSKDQASLTLEHEEGIGSLYFIFRYTYGEYTITNNDTGEAKTVGQGCFYHDFINLEALFGTAPKSVTVSFDNGTVRLNELYAFTPGETPDYVQKWELPVEGKTDLVLFSTHGDDEQLFFAGLLPYYANALDYQVQVVYLTDHFNLTTQRVHEMLNGLWAVGCTTYPVFGTFQDFLIESLDGTYAEFKKQGVSRDDIIEFCVEQIRRFKPLVTVAHDFAGEYSHGQHMVYADCVAAALEIANDPAQFPELAETYGTWDVPKAYFHLYEENPIVMDWDTPMEELDGMTPFQVTQELGFPCHESQQWTWFYGWIYGKNTPITKASEIVKYNPCQFGLYRTTVGADVEKNDFFENLTNYAELTRIEEEERLKAEEEARKQAEEEARLKAEEEARKKAEEEARQKEEEQKAAEEAARKAEAERIAAEEAAQKKQMLLLFSIAGVLLALIILVIILLATRRKKRRKK